MTPKMDEILSQKSMFRSSSKCMSGAEKRSETTTGVFEKQQTFPIEDREVGGILRKYIDFGRKDARKFL